MDSVSGYDGCATFMVDVLWNVCMVDANGNVLSWTRVHLEMHHDSAFISVLYEWQMFSVPSLPSHQTHHDHHLLDLPTIET